MHPPNTSLPGQLAYLSYLLSTATSLCLSLPLTSTALFYYLQTKHGVSVLTPIPFTYTLIHLYHLYHLYIIELARFYYIITQQVALSLFDVTR